MTWFIGSKEKKELTKEEIAQQHLDQLVKDALKSIEKFLNMKLVVLAEIVTKEKFLRLFMEEVRTWHEEELQKDTSVSCRTCFYGDWSYNKNHPIETLAACNSCDFFDNWEPITRR